MALARFVGRNGRMADGNAVFLRAVIGTTPARRGRVANADALVALVAANWSTEWATGQAGGRSAGPPALSRDRFRWVPMLVWITPLVLMAAIAPGVAVAGSSAAGKA